MTTRYWIGGRDWNDPAGWGGTVPGPDDIAVITDRRVLVAGSSGPVQSVRVGPSDFRYPLLEITGQITIAGELYTEGAVIDQGELTAGSLDGTLFVDGSGPRKMASADLGTLSSRSSLIVTGGPTGQATVVVHAPLNAYGFNLSGNASIEVPDQIRTLTGSILLNGAAARVVVKAEASTNSALATLSQISASGQLTLQNGASLASTGDLLNRGSLFVSSSLYAAPSTFTISGVLTNNQYTYCQGSSSIKTAGFVNNNITEFDNAITVSLGSVVQRGTMSLYGSTSVAATSFRQAASGALNLGSIQDGYTPILRAMGSVTLRGALDVQSTFVTGYNFLAMTFSPGQLTGMFDRIGTIFGTSFGSGTVITSPDGKTKAGLVYENAAGIVRFVSAQAPSTTIDTFKGTSGAWTAAANWSAGAPTFYSDVVIGNAAVSLAADATVNSVALNAGARLSTGLGTDLSVGATMAVAAAATLTVGGQATVDSALTNSGTVAVGSNARVDIRGNVGGDGTITIGTGATLILRADDTNTVNFAGSGATLQLDRAYGFKGTLANLVTGDVLEFAGVKVASASDDGKTLTVRKADTSTATFALSNKQAGTVFAVQDDFAGGSKLVVWSAPPHFSGALSSASAGTTPPANAPAEPLYAAFDSHGLFVPKPTPVLT